MKSTWRSCFFLFHSHDPKPKQNHQISISRAKIRSTQRQTCLKYRGNIICVKRNTDVNTGDLKILHKKCPNKVDFPDIIINFWNFLCALPSTLCLTGELWPLRFIWHPDLRVTHCQSITMTFVFTQYSFCNSLRHGLLSKVLEVLNKQNKTKKYCVFKNKYRSLVYKGRFTNYVSQKLGVQTPLTPLSAIVSISPTTDHSRKYNADSERSFWPFTVPKL